MFKRKLKLMSLVLALAMTISLLSPVKAYAAKPGPGTPAPTTTTINYVALGDSIATGTILGQSNITSYVTYFGQYLKSYYGRKTTVNVRNLAHDGDASNELLALLTHKEGTLTIAQGYHRDITATEALTMQNAVKSAHVITISIGGNNLMRAADIPGFTTINDELAKTGVDDFLAQWSDILTAIKALNPNPNLKIIVNTVYNPYNTRNTRLYPNDLELHNKVDAYLLQINTKITTSYGIRLADVHSSFHAYADDGTMGSVTYFYPSFISYLRNPHPTSTGQNIIKDLVIKAFNAN